MKEIGKKSFVSLIMLSLLLTAVISCFYGAAAAQAAGSGASSTTEDIMNLKTIKDLGGNTIKVGTKPKGIAAFRGSSVSRMIFFDTTDNVRCKMKGRANDWVKVICPGAYSSSSIVDMESGGLKNPNIEELISLGVDTVFYWKDLPEPTKKMQDAGIHVYAPSIAGVTSSTVDEWLDLLKEDMMMHAYILGDAKSIKKAKKWVDYTYKKVNFVVSRTKKLTDAQKPTVYCVRQQDDGLQCFCQGSNFSMLAEAAGAKSVAKDIKGQSGYTVVTMEQVASWNPDYIFMGWMNSGETLMKNEQWAGIKAIKDRNVYIFPCSMTTTDWSYCEECALEVLYTAKILHPTLFKDVDMISEIQNFYKAFYNYDLTKNQAQAMLERKGPGK